MWKNDERQYNNSICLERINTRHIVQIDHYCYNSIRIANVNKNGTNINDKYVISIYIYSLMPFNLFMIKRKQR